MFMNMTFMKLEHDRCPKPAGLKQSYANLHAGKSDTCLNR